MVAISFYRGNLQRVPDVPRRWLMPSPKISLREFKLLLARRSTALSRLRADAATTTTTSSSNPNPCSLSNGQNEVPTIANPCLEVQREPVQVTNNGEDHKESELVNTSVKKPVDGPDSVIDCKTDVAEKASEPVDSDAAIVEKHTPTIGDRGDMLNDKEKRKKEVEDKLQVLNAKKHNLVLVLKHILNAEEELKRRNSMQGIAMRPCVPFQADGTNDTGSLNRHMTPRIGSEADLGGDMECSETDELSNHNMHSRNVNRMSSMSPSSESPLRRTPRVQQNMSRLPSGDSSVAIGKLNSAKLPYSLNVEPLKSRLPSGDSSVAIGKLNNAKLQYLPNVVSHSSRASLGATGSPSRFTLSHQGNPMNPPLVSLSGTGYVASSPSPAASGGTSVFREARHPSPWN